MQAAVPSRYIPCSNTHQEHAGLGRAMLLPKNVTTVRQPLVCLKEMAQALCLDREACYHVLGVPWLQVEGCQECVSEGVELLDGHLDVLVNNAGIPYI